MAPTFFPALLKGNLGAPDFHFHFSFGRHIFTFHYQGRRSPHLPHLWAVCSSVKGPKLKLETKSLWQARSRGLCASMGRLTLLQVRVGSGVGCDSDAQGPGLALKLRPPGNTLVTGYWYGIELDQPTGKHDGSVFGVRYFTCAPRHGVFAPASRIQR